MTHDTTAAPLMTTDVDRWTWRAVLIGWAFTAVGTLGTGAQILAIVRGTLDFNVGPIVTLLLGLGLVLRHEDARRFAVAWAWFMLGFISLIVIALSIWSLVSTAGPGDSNRPYPLWVVLVVGLPLLALVIAALVILRHPATKAGFVKPLR